jgi:hypothetical protein
MPRELREERDLRRDRLRGQRVPRKAKDEAGGDVDVEVPARAEVFDAQPPEVWKSFVDEASGAREVDLGLVGHDARGSMRSTSQTSLFCAPLRQGFRKGRSASEAALAVAAAAATAPAPRRSTAIAVAAAAAASGASPEATAAAPEAAAAAAAAWRTPAARRTLVGRVHAERAALEIVAVHPRDGVFGHLGRTHRDEAEAAGAAALAIEDDVGVHDLPRLSERLTQDLFRHVEGKVADIKARAHRHSLSRGHDVAESTNHRLGVSSSSRRGCRPPRTG